MPSKSEHTIFDVIYTPLGIVIVVSFLIYGFIINPGSFRTQKNTFINLNHNMKAMWAKCPEVFINYPKMIEDCAKEYCCFGIVFSKFNQKMKRSDLDTQKIADCKKIVAAASRFQKTFIKLPDFTQTKKNDKDFEYKFEALSQSIIEANQTIKDWEIDLENQKNPPTLLVHH